MVSLFSQNPFDLLSRNQSIAIAMADLEKPFPIETEKVDNTTIEYERAQLLAHLPDPDAGKTVEERQAIVSITHTAPIPRNDRVN